MEAVVAHLDVLFQYIIVGSGENLEKKHVSKDSRYFGLDSNQASSE
jgi:hypothetical protein